jgi:hypothetical protein
MYKPITGGSSLLVGDDDLAIKVYLPPVGRVWNYDTNELEVSEIISRSSIPAEQYWERPKQPDNYLKKSRREKDLMKSDPEYYDSELKEYRDREWNRRLFGVWFMNNGEPVYLPGDYYFYLAHWTLDVGPPKFKIADLHKAYFWNYCQQDPNCYGLIEATKRRVGKCFGKGTKIRMFNGDIKPVEEIDNGDQVMGDDSTSRLVYGVVRGKEEMFNVIPNKGQTWTCNKSHILSLVWCLNKYNKKQNWRPKQVVNISVEDYLRLSNNEKRHLVLYRRGFELPARQHVVDPYFIGLWLGDGTSASIAITGIDQEIIDYVKETASVFGLKYRTADITHAISCDRAAIYEGQVDGHEYRFKSGVEASKYFGYTGKFTKTKVFTYNKWTLNKEGQTNKILTEFQRLNLVNNKHIPEEYLKDSSTNRLKLLAGLIDSDGHLNVKNSKPTNYAICQTNELLAEQIKDLALSLGFYASKNKYQTSMKRKDGTVYRGIAYHVIIYGDLYKIPCKVFRKRAPIVDFHVNRRNPLHTGFKIESIGVGDFYGFGVDGNNLFQLSDGTVVHNTYFGACMLYEYVSRTSNAHAGIQSKTGPDAGLVFQEKLIQPWRKLPDFFKPSFDTSKGDVPKTELRFFKTSKKGSKIVDEYDDGAELESWIDFNTSGSHAYDSQKMLRYMADELFKTTETNVIKRHAVVKPCLENENGEIIGKAIYTSTVEEMEGYLDLYVKIWGDSDFYEKNENGRTKSGLYRFFTPAQNIMYVDKYGIPDVQRALKQIENEIEAMTDPRDISAYLRKNPRNWKEAFRTSGDNCLFDPIKLDDRISTLQFKNEKDIFERYDLIWDDDVPEGEIPKVRWIKNRNGRFRFLNDFFERFEANDVSRRGSNFLPKNNLRFTIGIDPFDHNRTKDGKFSQGAAAIFQKHDPLDDENSENFIGFYLGRPSSSGIFYEDMVKLCHLLSCQMLYEDNKPKISDHFIDRGYANFLVRDKAGHPGISGSPKTHQIMAEHIESFIDANCHRVMFLELLNDWKGLDLTNTTAFDLAMASGYSLIAASNIKRVESKLNKLKKVSPANFVRKYNLKKGHAKRGYSKFSKPLRKS